MLHQAIAWLVFDLFRFDDGSALGHMLHFFLYDTIKIMLLLFFMISFLGFWRTFLNEEKLKKWLGRKKGIAHFYAALFGAVTPFCSCSSIPIFLSFVKMGIPLGVMFSFLITSPLINEYLVVLMLGFFGWKISLMYVISGMVLGVGLGIIFGKLGLEKYLVKDMIGSSENKDSRVEYQNIKQRILFGVSEGRAILKRIWFWIVIGVGIGAVIHNYIPKEAIQEIINKTGLFSVPLAAGLGVPMYGGCAAIVPIAVVLFRKGVPLGTALAFMMATSALSLPEAVILRRAMKLQLIAIFFGITTLGIILTGYLFNFLQGFLS